MPVNIDGLISGIDTETIIAGLLEIQQTQVDRFTLRRNEIQERQAAFRGIEARLLTLRSDLGRLSRTQNNPFTRRVVTISDESAIAATAADRAVPGVYQLTVNSKARAHQVASQGYADADARITQGSLELRVGSADPVTVNIDSNNNTLRGLADSINAAGAGLTASIVRDASGGSTPYRLLVTSTKTGSANQIAITNNTAASSGDEIQVAIDLDNPVQAAADAQITLGSGVGAIAVTSDTNRFEGVIEGVTLDLMQITPDEEISLTVSADTEGATTAIEDFVEGFNEVIRYIDDLSKYNAETNQAGLLLGNRGAASVLQKLRSAALAVVPGVNSAANRLSTIGISVTDSGRLQLNQTRLNDVLSGRVDNISSNDVRSLFALDGNSNRSGVSFVLGSTRTKASETPYQVDISQAAEQAKLTGGTPLAESTVITSANRDLEVKVDGATANVRLNEGTYTRQELADHVESVINASKDLLGRKVQVGLTADQLQISSLTYGTSSELLIVSGSSLTDLGLSGGQTAVGRDVVGNFIVNGNVESAVGRGRVLSGNSDNENTADLQIRVTLTPDQVISGPEAEITVTRGIAASLDNLLSELLRPNDGILAAADEGFNGQIDSIQQTIDRQKGIFDRAQASLLKQFTALESALGQLQSTSNFVSTQLASLGG